MLGPAMIEKMEAIFNKGKKEGYKNNLFKSLISNMIEIIDSHRFKVEFTRSEGFINAWIREVIRDWDNFNFNDATKIINSFKISDTNKKMFLNVFPKGVKETQEAINKIKAGSTKLPNKKLKLESMMESITKELLTAPPHYIVDRYKIILTSDINANNYSQFMNNFRAGRIISSGKVSEMNDDFTQELIYKTMNENKLKIDNNFYYVIFEGLE